MLHKTSEADIIKQLLKEDRKLWERLCTEQVSDRAEEMCCGWKAVRPSATYDLTRPPRRKKAPAATALYTASTVSVRSRNDDSDGKRPNMSGELDENCSYIYKGGLSSRADTGNDAAAASRPSPQPQRHVQTVTLEPSTANYTSANALVNCRDELSRILALQLKPELLVEQLIIENRLRTMSLAAFPVLEGREESRLKESDSSRYSHSTPALLPNTHVNYQYRRAPCHGGLGRRVRAHSHKPPETRQAPKAKPHHLHWCKSLSSHSNSQHGDLQIVPSNSQPPSCSPQLQFCDQVTYSRVSCSSKYPPNTSGQPTTHQIPPRASTIVYPS